MIINKAYKFRIYPTSKQEKILASFFGQTRFVYNFFLHKKIDYYVANKGKEKHGTVRPFVELRSPDQSLIGWGSSLTFHEEDEKEGRLA